MCARKRYRNLLCSCPFLCAHAWVFVLVSLAPLFVPILITAADNPIVTVLLQQPTALALWRREINYKTDAAVFCVCVCVCVWAWRWWVCEETNMADLTGWWATESCSLSSSPLSSACLYLQLLAGNVWETERWRDGWMDGWMDGQTDRCTFVSNIDCVGRLRVWCPIKFELIWLALPNSDGAMALLYDRRRWLCRQRSWVGRVHCSSWDNEWDRLSL